MLPVNKVLFMPFLKSTHSAKLSVVCMFFRGLLKSGCSVSLKARSAQRLLWPKAVEWESDYFFPVTYHT